MSKFRIKNRIFKAGSRRLWTLVLFVFAAQVALIVPFGEARADAVTQTFSSHDANSATTIDHGAWDKLLSDYVTPSADGINRVDYKTFKDKDQKALKSYVASLEAIDPRKLSKNEQLAYWANLYNAKTVDIILDEYPIASIRDISLESGFFDIIKKSVGAGGPWKTKVLKVAGQDLGLDNIEHNILRPIFQDPRVHYAVNCASIGCPNLGTKAFRGENVDEMLTEGAKAYVNNARGIRVTNGKVSASSIYNWFADDFGGDDAGVLKHVRKYASDELNSKLEKATGIDSYAYDWSLNDIKR